MVEHASIDDAAAARVGDCSGALIAADLVLTAGHCLAAPIAFIEVGGERIRVRDCVAHPSFQAGDAKHDLAVCRLDGTSHTMPLALDLNHSIDRGTDVTMFGFGSATPFGPPALSVRRIETTVTAIREGIFVIGTPEKTACTGDSGAPVIATSGEVIGVVHGTTGRFCASPADVVPLAANRDWLLTWLRVPEETGGGGWPTLVVAAFALAILGGILRRRRTARDRCA